MRQMMNTERQPHKKNRTGEKKYNRNAAKFTFHYDGLALEVIAFERIG